MILVTGAAGFIGSCMVKRLNEAGYFDLVVVDEFAREEKRKNLDGKMIHSTLHRDQLWKWLEKKAPQVDFIIHLGARTNTAEFDWSIFETLNLGYSKKIWETATKYRIPLIYASSAATYGLGELGYNDDENLIPELQPLNPYGKSKNEFDKWLLKQKTQPPFYAGLKFFNVYGPNEYHKGRMASVISRAFSQIQDSGKVKLFRSHRPDVEDGQQLRDFIYVKDITSVIHWMMEKQPESGIYNLGTGVARSFFDLATATFNSLGISPAIEYIDIPADIREKYQYYTQAEMTKLRKAGYSNPFTSLEEGVNEYVKEYLKTGQYL
ncbi:MAG: ADP-glyceromanno-heptose 6-epimerase [Bacteroidales bacterium]|nr:ADP-glyceromanno-heptose 6-epimerase [Bacteroidales bacterium]MDD2323526.1 ADP-glyceromanno-heptose 6-epimerase [Bacteroidales bacterium]MDD3010653.1 ADP-glyceromanno-heptose 6-epimerase [Bacteroidales bacterium]MDD3960984.1 ADP-glyceromanno-heptose 6-epimerase [Bacteroidales bacterium]MDY0284571.1 ADP-glyceromanno-heptose 6-epimerase [Bacteroidales bacterium]